MSQIYLNWIPTTYSAVHKDQMINTLHKCQLCQSHKLNWSMYTMHGHYTYNTALDIRQNTKVQVIATCKADILTRLEFIMTKIQQQPWLLGFGWIKGTCIYSIMLSVNDVYTNNYVQGHWLAATDSTIPYTQRINF